MWSRVSKGDKARDGDMYLGRSVIQVLISKCCFGNGG